MCARCFSSRRTSPFSPMIWSIFRTLVYCVGLRRTMASWTTRTVEAPRLHRTVRISSSASVGRGGSDGLADIYEDYTTKSVVESRRNCRTRNRTTLDRIACPRIAPGIIPDFHIQIGISRAKPWLFDDVFAFDGGSGAGVCAGEFVVAGPDQ